MAEVGAIFDGIERDGASRESSSPSRSNDRRLAATPTRRLFTSGSFRVLEDTLITMLRTLRAADLLAPLWVVVPTNVLSAHLARRFATEHGGHANVRFLTLLDFAAEVAEAELLAAGSGPAPPFFPRALVRALLREEVAAVFGNAADTAGFQQALLGVLQDLADALVEPDALRAVAANAPQDSPARAKFTCLADVADEFRRRLRASAIFDRSALLDAACTRLETGAALPPSPLLLYGFYDLTPLQRRLVSAASRRLDMVAWMPWQHSPAFAYAAPTRTWFQAQGFQIVPLPARAESESDLSRARRGMFQVPDHLERPADGSVRILSAPGELREVREIGREVLGLVRARRLRFEEIGVLVRTPEPYQRLIADELERAAIPFCCSARTTLAHTVAGRSLALLMRVRLENFARARVIEWMNAAPLPPGEYAVTAASCDWFSRAAGVVAGADEWRGRLARLQERYERMAGERPDNPHAAAPGRTPQDLERCRAFMEGLLTALEQMPDTGCWDVLVSGWLRIFRDYIDDPAVEDVVRALQHLTMLDRVEAGTSLHDVAQAMAEVLGETAAPEGQLGRGVFVGDIMQARGVPFRAVIVPGLVEKVLPRPIHQDPIVPDDEREVLNEQFGAELSLKQRGFEEERLLFALMLDAAEDALVLTFPRLDAATASPRLPSWFLLHVLAAVRGRQGGFSDLESWDRVERLPLAQQFPEDPASALDRVEFDLSSAAAAVRTGDIGPVRHVFATLLARQALIAERARAGQARFTPYDGVFAHEATQRLLRRGAHHLSATRIQTYARCPFQYFLRYELGLEPLIDPERVMTLASHEVGILVHGILHRFFTAAGAAGWLPLERAPGRALVTLLEQVTAEACERTALDGVTGIPLLWRRLRAELAAALRAWLDGELARTDGYRPAAFEVAFGGRDAPALGIGLGAQRSVWLSGRIDRIDFHPDGSARIVDYKTGRPRRVMPEQVDVDAIQLPIYMLASRRLFPGRRWAAACFVPIATGDRSEAACFEPPDWKAAAAALTEIVAAVADGIAAGVFPPGKPTCRSCAFPSICGGARPLFARKLVDERVPDWRGVALLMPARRLGSEEEESA